MGHIVTHHMGTVISSAWSIIDENFVPKQCKVSLPVNTLNMSGTCVINRETYV